MVKKTPRAKEVPPKLSQKTIELLAEAAESATDAELPKTQPTNPASNPPNPFPDLFAKSEDGVDCPNGETNGGPNGEANCDPDGEADEEMPPLVDETEV